MKAQNQKRRTITLSAACIIAAASLGSCAKEQIVEPQQSAMAAEALTGAWLFASSDGEDISSYGIRYQFEGETWQYTMPNVGTKTYAFNATDGRIAAELRASSFPSNEKVGTAFDAAYTISGDTLRINFDGHEGILLREKSPI